MIEAIQIDWRTALYSFIEREAQPPEKFGHQPRLYELTQQVGQGIAYDDDIVYAACYLHDLGVFIGHRPEDPELLPRWDNTAYAVAQAPQILANIDFPAERIPSVQAAIATHQPHHTPDSIEATILRDADILEQLGAIAILRTTCKVGRDTRFHTFTQAVASLTKALETLPPLICLPRARTLAEPRIQALRSFLEAVHAEAASNLL
jgi:uncharacterized protein